MENLLISKVKIFIILWRPFVGPPKILENALNTQYRAKGFENWTYEVENIDGALHVRHKNINLKVPDPTDKAE